MMLPLLTLLLACTVEDPQGPAGPQPDTDLIVVGSGGAGLAAAIAAQQLGASVVILERQETAGGASMYGGINWAAGSSFLESMEIEDSVEKALEDWPLLTGGGDPSDPTVQTFVTESASVLDWVVYEVGSSFYGVAGLPSEGRAPRNHSLGTGDDAAIWLMEQMLVEPVWTGCEVVDLRWEDGAVVGVTYVQEGEERTLRAPAVVVASGGFARNLDWIRADRPELASLPVGFDHAPGVDAGGHRLLEEAGATWQNQGGLGIYMHAVADWRSGHEGEILLAHGLASTAVVGPHGQRVGNEALIQGFTFADHLAEAGRLVAIYPQNHFNAGAFLVTEYNLGDWESGLVTPEMLYEAGVAYSSSDLYEVALALDLDPEGLAEGMARYEAYVEQGQDEDFGKAARDLLPYEGRYVAVELLAGANKAFSGWRTDEHMAVLDTEGQPIPGLYGAGEVIGMLGTPAVGRGFTGSMTAVYWSGLTAGEAAVSP